VFFTVHGIHVRLSFFTSDIFSILKKRVVRADIGCVAGGLVTD